MYFQTPEAALANCGRAYLITDGHVKPSSTFSNDGFKSDLLKLNNNLRYKRIEYFDKIRLDKIIRYL